MQYCRSVSPLNLVKDVIFDIDRPTYLYVAFLKYFAYAPNDSQIGVYSEQ